MSSDSSARAELLIALNAAMQQMASQITFFSTAAAATLRMHPTDLDCLGVLATDGPQTPGRLAERTGLTTGAVTGVVDRLAAAGFVTRDVDPADRRRVVVRAVPERLAEIHAIHAPMIEASAEVCEPYSDDELALIVDFATRSTPMLLEETLKLRDVGPPDDDDPAILRAPRTGRADAILRFPHGASRLDLGTDPDLDDLFVATWHGTKPTVKVDGNDVTVQYRRSMFSQLRTWAQIRLDASRTWSVLIDGGLHKVSLDLAGTRVSRIVLTGGMSSSTIDLPRPDGTMDLYVKGGVSAVTVSRPKGVPVSVAVKGGATNLFVGGERHRTAGKHAITTPGYAKATDRLAVEIIGGASSVQLTER